MKPVQDGVLVRAEAFWFMQGLLGAPITRKNRVSKRVSSVFSRVKITLGCCAFLPAVLGSCQTAGLHSPMQLQEQAGCHLLASTSEPAVRELSVALQCPYKILHHEKQTRMVVSYLGLSCSS